MKSLLVRLSKVLLRFALDEGLRRSLPEIYKRLDVEVPVPRMSPERDGAGVGGSIRGRFLGGFGSQSGA